MGVLTLAGKPIDWTKPPETTARVMWSQRATNGEPVTGSLRTIAHLDHLSILAMAKYRVGISVIQPPYNTGVKASAGTHDFDACSDVKITGVPWEEQQRFFRANGFAAYYRRPPAFGEHIHGFTLPPRSGGSVVDDFAEAGFKVGKYVDGGFSLFGKRVASAQIEDYYWHRTALAGHEHDPSWFPPNIAATIFNLNAYIKRQLPKKQPTLSVALINIPAKIGAAKIKECWEKAAARGAVLGVNESFHVQQRAIYKALAKEHGYDTFGLDRTPNPVFWRRSRLTFAHGRVHLIHEANTTAANAKKWPGFYDERSITEVILKLHSGKQVAVLNTHFVYGAKVIDQRWLRQARRESKALLRELVRENQAKGRIVIAMGDTNMVEPFAMPRGFKWLRGRGIDKMGSNRDGDASLFTAPTDHKHGVRARIRL